MPYICRAIFISNQSILISSQVPPRTHTHTFRGWNSAKVFAFCVSSSSRTQRIRSQQTAAAGYFECSNLNLNWEKNCATRIWIYNIRIWRTNRFAGNAQRTRTQKLINPCDICVRDKTRNSVSVRFARTRRYIGGCIGTDAGTGHPRAGTWQSSEKKIHLSFLDAPNWFTVILCVWARCARHSHAGARFFSFVSSANRACQSSAEQRSQNANDTVFRLFYVPPNL